tara:strand:+ start:100 stop:249 length:150 start_codon:yes stop_codon:yes gene_type:complete
MGKGMNGNASQSGAMKILKHMSHHRINSRELEYMPIADREKDAMKKEGK